MSLYVLSQNSNCLVNLDKANSVIIKRNSYSGNYDLMAYYDFNYRICVASYGTEEEAKDALAGLIPNAMANTTPVVIALHRDGDWDNSYKDYVIGEHNKHTRLLDPVGEEEYTE